MVVYIHYSYQIPAIASTGKYGYLGIHVFFVISGFVLPYSLHTAGFQTSDFFRFLFKRVLRIDPPYLVAVLIAILLPFWNGRGLLGWSTIFAHLGYLNDILNLPWASGIFWTLAIEFQFYIALGVLYKGFACRSNTLSILFLSILLLLCTQMRSAA